VRKPRIEDDIDAKHNKRQNPWRRASWLV